MSRTSSVRNRQKAVTWLSAQCPAGTVAGAAWTAVIGCGSVAGAAATLSALAGLFADALPKASRRRTEMTSSGVSPVLMSGGRGDETRERPFPGGRGIHAGVRA